MTRVHNAIFRRPFFYAVDHFGSGCLRLLGFAFAQMASPPKRPRLRTKTPPPRRPQTPVVGIALEPREADAKKGRQVYLVTLPHPKAGASTEGRPLVAPGALSKKATLAAFLDCCAHPVYVDPRSIRANLSIPMKYEGVWREFHAEDADGDVHEHDHLAVLAMREFMYLPVSRALRERYGLAPCFFEMLVLLRFFHPVSETLCIVADELRMILREKICITSLHHKLCHSTLCANLEGDAIPEWGPWPGGKIGNMFN